MEAEPVIQCCSEALKRYARVVIGVFIAAGVGCTSQRDAQVPAVASPAAADPSLHEVYRGRGGRVSGSDMLFLPGSSTSQLVHYQVVDGVAVVEGDVVLGPAQTLRQRYALPRLFPSQVKGAVAVSDRTLLWPKSQIPYEVASSAHASTADIRSAIEELNQTSLKLRPRAPSDADYVVFTNDDAGCWSYLGRIGGAQPIQIGPECPRGSVIHEILHAAGFLHEQSRNDRDQHVQIVWDEIIAGERSQFETRPDLSYDVGPYDYASILHYGPRAFSRTGKPTIIPKIPGVTIGQREGLSALDRAAIETVYGSGAGAVAPQPAIPVPPAPAPVTSPPEPAAPAAPQPPAAPAPARPVATAGSFAGTYASEHGTVVCQQEGQSVQCRFDDGVLMCVARQAVLDCGWTGRGVGRATFTRRQDGSVAGTWGDAFSNTSRGSWTWVLSPAGASAPAVPSPSPASPPQTPAAPAAVSAPASLAGNYDSTRGPMNCTDNGALWSCSFQDASGATGRLDCSPDASGAQFTCTWMTFLPNPAAGRAVFTRSDPSGRELRGTWGYLHAVEGGGTWDATGR